jgi:hypothetical protein
MFCSLDIEYLNLFAIWFLKFGALKLGAGDLRPTDSYWKRGIL